MDGVAAVKQYVVVFSCAEYGVPYMPGYCVYLNPRTSVRGLVGVSIVALFEYSLMDLIPAYFVMTQDSASYIMPVRSTNLSTISSFFS